ncbi:MAG: nuclear transport factor 2 family protein [Polyangiaceae bacterium]
MKDDDNVERARAYLRALEDESPEEVLRTFYTEDVEQHEYPNRLVPNGTARDLAALLAGNVKGRSVVQNQKYDVRGVVASGDTVALEVAWSATLRVPVGALGAGDSMRARFAVFLDFRGGKIHRQRNYDCFDPF